MKPKVRTKNPFTPEDRTDTGFPNKYAKEDFKRKAAAIMGNIPKAGAKSSEKEGDK
jgi:hypothetical protein